MASTSQAEDVPASASPAAAAAKMGSQDHIPPASSSPVEMSNLQSVEQSQSLQHGGERQEDTTAGAEDSTPAPEPSTSAEPSSPTTVPQPQEPTQPQPTLTRQQTEALGPATDGPLALPSSSADRGSALTITLMLTTGARHPYKIDEKYLKNRKVDSLSMNGSFDPREISGYKLKELIWTDWRTEWEPRPASPSSIRLIILGRFVEDKAALKDLPFKLDQPNVLHMTVKPADFLEDDDPAGKGAAKGHSIRGRDGEERGAGCRCVIL